MTNQVVPIETVPENEKKPYTLSPVLFNDSFANFAKLVRAVVDDPNGTARSTSSYRKYTRAQILNYLNDPIRNSAALVNSSIYLYSTVLLYKRLCTYMATLPTYDYLLYPIGLNDKANPDQYRTAYYKALETLENMNLKSLAIEIMTVCVREGAYYGIELSNKDSYMPYRFPHDYCRITAWEAGCPLYSLNMAYFDRSGMTSILESMPASIQSGYRTYKSNNKLKWFEVPSAESICILADETIDGSVPVPLMAGCFPDLYLLDEYKDLVKAKSIIDIYKLLFLKVPTDEEGNILIEEGILTKWFQQVGSQLPESIGLGMAPMEMTSVSFDKNQNDVDMTSRAERDLFGATGVSQMVMSNTQNSASAVKNSIINDFLFVKPILLNIQDWLNKKLRLATGVTKYQIVFCDVNSYGREAEAAELAKSMQYGIPNRMIYSAIAMGYSPALLTGMNFLEVDVLKLPTSFVPLQSANTASGSGQHDGHPEINPDNLTDSGNQTREGK